MVKKTSEDKTPLVSIITATYNDELYIENSIRSVLSQDFTDCEYIIINDGSIDNTKKIAQRLQKEDSRIRLKNLYKMNRKDGEYVPEIGDRLRLR